jgi:predicted ATPase/DNA-binding SARP family transcriptional activator
MLEDIWRFTLLGSFRVQQGPIATERFRTRKTASLLAYLAFHPHAVHHREELATLLWPDVSPDLGLKSLGVALSSLRKLLEPPGVSLGTVLVADRRTARLNPGAIQTDVAVFQQALHSARGTGEVSKRRLHLETAIGLYGGELLRGFYEEWIFPERDLLSLAHRRALQELILLLESSGLFTDALVYALKDAAADSYDDESYARLMRLYVAAGQPAAALRHYTNLERRLLADLGQHPSEETRKLAKQLREKRNGEPDVSIRSEPLPAGSHVSPSQAPSDEIRLPLTLTRFFGRETEIDQLQELLKQRLITLTGPGGSGKTRLAIEAARRFAERFSGRILFVPLADLATPREIPAAIRKTLRLPDLPGAPGESELTASLATNPTLLVLDNLEHLLPVNETESDGARPFILHLLDQVPGLAVLTTSRQSLGLAGEQEFPVMPLPIPPAEDLSQFAVSNPKEVMQFACIQLFADRARLRQPDFQITSGNIKTIAALCQRLDGIPLAIELAAGLSRILPPEAMLIRLRKTQDALVSRQKQTPDRHRSLNGAIEWSYRLLPPRLKTVFRRLSVFHGGWTPEAANAVCGELADSLALLEERSLIITEPHGVTAGYRMLETIREFGYEHMRKLNEDARVRRLHASYFAELANTHRLDGKMPEVVPSEKVALIVLENQYQNVCLALDWFIEDPRRQDNAVRLSAILGRFWLLSRRFHEGAERLDAILPAARRSRQILPLCSILLHAGLIAWFHGDYVRCLALCEELLRVARKHRLPDQEAAALHSLGVLAAMRGEFARRDSLLAEAISIWRRLQDHNNLAWSLMSMGWLLVGQGLDRQAKPLLEESLSIYVASGDALQSAWCQMYLSLITCRSGDPQAAQRIAQQALAAFHKEGSAGGQLWMLLHISTIAIAFPDLERAAVLLGQVQRQVAVNGVELPPAESTEYAQNLEHIHSSLSEQDSKQALARGLAMNLQQAVQYALLKPIQV